jgi:glycosyltransferase involved in cell wall biosynthesis
MEKPIIMGVGGEAWNTVRQSGAGINMDPENSVALFKALDWLVTHPSLAQEFGRHGKAYVVSHFDRRSLSGRYLELVAAMLSTQATIEKSAHIRSQTIVASCKTHHRSRVVSGS